MARIVVVLIRQQTFDQAAVFPNVLGRRSRALGECARTTGVETTAGWNIGGIGAGVTETGIGNPQRRIRRQHGGEKRLSVGMHRPAKQVLRRRMLEDPA
jgi:hypothetical protein